MPDPAITPVETGLVTAAVNPPAVPVQVPAVAPPQVPATQMPSGWTIHKVAALVRDLAHNMYDLPYILKTHGLTQAQYDSLAGNEFFKHTLQAMTVEWNAVGNTQKRLALEAAIALEDALPAVAARLSKNTEPLAGVVELAKLLAKMAGVGEANAQQVPTERFKITINLGADVASFEKSRPVIEIGASSEAQGGVHTLQPQP
jgi:hypothetical protein